MQYNLRMEQKTICGHCAINNTPICCEQNCHYYKVVKMLAGWLACTHCEKSISCEKKTKAEST